MSEVLIELCAGTEPERWWQDGRTWYRQDGAFHEDIDEVMPLPFYLSSQQDESVDEYVANHIVEHFNFLPPEKIERPIGSQRENYNTSVDEILGDIYRSLKPGGKIHIEVPNIAGSSRAYHNGEITGEQLCEYIFGGSENKYNQHFIGFTPESLQRRLEKHGFIGNVNDIGLVVVADFVKS